MRNAQCAKQTPGRMNFTPTPVPNTPRPRVLMAVRDDTHAHWAQRALSALSCEVVRVDGTQHAVDAACNDNFSLVLLDCREPAHEGTHTAREIRAHEGTRNRRPVPIIGMAQSHAEGERQGLLDSGINHVHVGPLQLKSLALLLVRWRRA